MKMNNIFGCRAPGWQTFLIVFFFIYISLATDLKMAHKQTDYFLSLLANVDFLLDLYVTFL